MDELQKASEEKDDYAQRCHDLDLQVNSSLLYFHMSASLFCYHCAGYFSVFSYY